MEEMIVKARDQATHRALVFANNAKSELFESLCITVPCDTEADMQAAITGIARCEVNHRYEFEDADGHAVTLTVELPREPAAKDRAVRSLTWVASMNGGHTY
jgi:hypothetical protein